MTSGRGPLVTKIGLPQFSRKRTIASAELLLNPNNGQKYKAIFGMDFLLENGIDFINSRQEIAWKDISVSIHDLNKITHNERTNNNKDKEQMTSNTYRKSTASQMANHKNQAHLTQDRKPNSRSYSKDTSISWKDNYYC